MNTIVWERANKPPQMIINEDRGEGIIFHDNIADMDMWIGHTNFLLSKNIVKQIGSIEGVEYVANSSRYRFIIAIGKAFSSAVVKNAINLNLSHGATNINEQMIGLKNRVSSGGVGILVPNGKTIFVDNKKEDREFIKNLIKVKNIVNGIMIKSK